MSLTTPKGGVAPIDPFSFDEILMTDNTLRFLKDPAAQRVIANTLRFNDIDPNDYAGVFFPGGYGQLWDLASDSKVIRSIEHWVEEQTPVAMVCHAPGILRDAKKSNDEPLVSGMEITGYSDAEDNELDLPRHLLFSLERALTINGGRYKRANRNWSANVIEDGALMTGQNPASAAPLAEALVSRLQAHEAAAQLPCGGGNNAAPSTRTIVLSNDVP